MNFKNLSNKIIAVLTLGFISFTSCSQDLQFESSKEEESLDTIYSLPLAGNAFLSSTAETFSAIISKAGLANWNSDKTITSTYIRVNKGGKLALGLKAKVLPAGQSSRVAVSVNGTSKTIDLSGSTAKSYTVGEFEVEAGYV